MTIAIEYGPLGLVDRSPEETVVEAMLTDESVAIELARRQELTADDFFDTRLGTVYQAIINLVHGVEPITYRTVIDECKRMKPDWTKWAITEEYLDTIHGVPGRWEGYSRRVKRMSELRKAADMSAWVLNQLNNRQPLDSIVDGLQERLRDLVKANHNESDWVWGGDTIDMYDEYMTQRVKMFKEGKTNPFDWPWASWNRLILPMREGMVGVIAAPDGMGKSTYLELIAEYWAQKGLQVVLVHLEDSLQYKLDRRAARWSDINLRKIEEGNLDEGEQFALDHAQNRIAKFAGNLHYYSAPGQSMQEIVAFLETKKEEGLVDVVVLDYIDKVQPSRSQIGAYGSNPWERQANDMEQLKTMAEKMGIPVLTATQGNKSMQEEGTQTRKAIQGSGQKSQKAQLVVILTRALEDSGEWSSVVTVRIDKQNRGTTGMFSQVIQGGRFRVLDAVMERHELN